MFFFLKWFSPTLKIRILLAEIFPPIFWFVNFEFSATTRRLWLAKSGISHCHIGMIHGMIKWSKQKFEFLSFYWNQLKKSLCKMDKVKLEDFKCGNVGCEKIPKPGDKIYRCPLAPIQVCLQQWTWIEADKLKLEIRK